MTGTVIAALAILAAIVWLLVALALAVVIGMGIAAADRAEVKPKPCCPHPRESAPETVRGEFRAIIPASIDRRGSRLDVRA